MRQNAAKRPNNFWMFFKNFLNFFNFFLSFKFSFQFYFHFFFRQLSVRMGLLWYNGSKRGSNIDLFRLHLEKSPFVFLDFLHGDRGQWCSSFSPFLRLRPSARLTLNNSQPQVELCPENVPPSVRPSVCPFWYLKNLIIPRRVISAKRSTLLASISMYNI